MGYADDLKIDENALDREFIMQPSKYMEYAKKAAQADSERKKAKESLELTLAKLDKHAREKAAENGEKVTEKVIDGRVKMADDYQDALAEVRDAEYSYSVLIGAVRAFDQRKTALENLVKLYIGGYFSAPQQDTNDTEETLSKRTSAGQKDRLNKKREERKRKD